MDWLNYHHLYYFWTTAREGSISQAARTLHLSQPTVSGQLRQLEKSVGAKLYEKSGRSIRLTETGQLVFQYANEIFQTGQELMQKLRGDLHTKRTTFTIGIPDYMPKFLAYRLIEPAMHAGTPLHLVCHEGKLHELLGELAMHRLDLVLSDSTVGSQVNIKAYNHFLGETAFSWVGIESLCDQLRDGYPESLDDQPLIIPTSNTVLRRSLERWLDEQEFTPEVIAEVEDSSLLKILAAQGLGLAPVANASLDDVESQHKLVCLGAIDGVQMQFYAITMERKVKHPAVKAITDAARTTLFADTASESESNHQ